MEITMLVALARNDNLLFFQNFSRLSSLIPLRGLFLLLARDSLQAASPLASCVGSSLVFF